MRKVFLILSLFILLNSFVYADLITNHTYSSPSYASSVYIGGSTYQGGQRFRFNSSTYASAEIKNITVYLGKASAGGTFINMSIRGDGVTAPNSSQYGTSGSYSVTLPTASVTQYTIPINATISNNTIYWFIIGGDYSDKGRGSRTTSSAYFSDDFYTTNGGSTWTDDTGQIMWFQINGSFISPTGTTSSPSFVSPTPINNSHNNTQVTINMSCANANLYTLWFNGTKVLDNSTISYYITNVSSSASFEYLGACYNGSLSGYSANSSVYTWVYDVTYPTITLNSDNAFNIYNLTNINQYINNMTLNLSFVDNSALYAYEVNITTSGGVSVFNVTNQSLSGVSYNYSYSLNTSSWADGWYYVRIDVADSHTAKEISNYQITKKKSSMTFKTPNDNNIKIETRESATIDAIKYLDRYSFLINFDDGLTKTRVFDVKTDKCPLTYLPNSQFKGHFVSLCSIKEGGNWIDFEGVSGSVSVTKSDDYHYVVTILNVAPVVEFKSIGGLNIYTAYHKWYKGSKSQTAANVGVGEPNNVSITLTRDSGSQSNFTATFVYNGTTYTPNKSMDATSVLFYYDDFNAPSTEGSYNYTWVFNLTQSDNSSIGFNISGSQNVYNWSISNCSSGNKTLTFNIYLEEYPTTAATADFEIEMSYWLSSPLLSKNLTKKLTGASSYSFCMSPNATMYVDVYAKYTTVGGFTHRYFLRNQSLTFTETNYSIYNFNTTSGLSDLKITTRYYDNYRYYSEVIAKLQRYYLDEGVWRTVQMDESGEFGIMFFNIREEVADYRLLYYDQNNNLLKTTSSSKFVCSLGICDLTQLLNPETATSTTDNLTISHSFDNATRILTVSWDDPEANNNNVQIRVTKETITGTANICVVNQTGAAGSYACNMTGYTGEVLVSVLTSHSPFTPIYSAWVLISRALLSGLVDQAEGAFWTFGIMLSCVGFGLFSPVAALIAMFAGLIFIFFIGLFTPLTMTFMIVATAIGIAIGIKVKK